MKATAGDEGVGAGSDVVLIAAGFRCLWFILTVN